MPLPNDFHAVLSAAEHHGVPLGSVADDIRAEFADLAIEQARTARQSRITVALPGFRRAVELKLRALEPSRVTLPTLPSSAGDVFVFTRQSACQLGAPHDPTTRTFTDVHVAFVGAPEWSRLRAVTAHRTLDLVFFAAGPFDDLRALWSRASNWSGIPATGNSSHSPGPLEGVLDRLVGSVPDSLIATWYRMADVHLASQIRAACQRLASRTDPEHGRRWSPPWEQAEAAE